MADITVGQYAATRDISESRVKQAIRDQRWELPKNPRDARQRLLSNEQQAFLDNEYGWMLNQTVETYERPQQIAETIIQGVLVEDQINAGLIRIESNPLLLAIQARVDQVTQANAIQMGQINQNALACGDLEKALDAMADQAAIQRGQQRAMRDAQLEQASYQEATTQIRMVQAGFAAPMPVPNGSAASAAQPSSIPVESYSPVSSDSYPV